ncbi:MAG: hypothetical protein FWG73_05335 [Planctomycetaceae bacterium]|nr:hypothetical protein [Planctomycetaceae bacterium]
MSTTLSKPKSRVPKRLSHSPKYITILPVGEMIDEKISEMGIDVAELARRMELPLETVEQLIRFEIPLTREYAEKLEQATLMPADVMLHFEAWSQEKFAFAMEHPEIPAYLGEEMINRPKKNGARS